MVLGDTITSWTESDWEGQHTNLHGAASTLPFHITPTQPTTENSTVDKSTP